MFQLDVNWAMKNPNSVLCVCFTHSRIESCVLFAQLFWLTSVVCCFFGKRWQYRPWWDLSKLRFSSILLLDRSNVRNCVATWPDQEIKFSGLIFLRTTAFDCLSVGGGPFYWIDQIWVAKNWVSLNALAYTHKIFGFIVESSVMHVPT